MKNNRLIGTLLSMIMMSLIMSGCSSEDKFIKSFKECVIASAVVGGVIGATDSAGSAAAGAAGLAIVGGVICAAALRPETDSDGDGVIDRIDACGNTQAGVKVDPEGCPVDDDKDGVPDSLDKCLGTERGAPIDVRGCELDGDQDGVPNRLDRCPATILGSRVDATGCSNEDSDGDGVVDGRDQCANTPRGSTVDNQGCTTVADQDGDGVADGTDQCANTPRGTQVGPLGCAADKAIILQGVNFKTNSAELTDESGENLDKVAQALENQTNLAVDVVGYTDSTGSAEYNLLLSQRRAESVRDYLIRQGISAARLTARGEGENQPIADNNTAVGRAENRRVELKTRALN